MEPGQGRECSHSVSPVQARLRSIIIINLYLVAMLNKKVFSIQKLSLQSKSFHPMLMMVEPCDQDESQRADIGCGEGCDTQSFDTCQPPGPPCPECRWRESRNTREAEGSGRNCLHHISPGGKWLTFLLHIHRRSILDCVPLQKLLTIIPVLTFQIFFSFELKVHKFPSHLLSSCQLFSRSSTLISELQMNGLN